MKYSYSQSQSSSVETVLCHGFLKTDEKISKHVLFVVKYFSKFFSDFELKNPSRQNRSMRDKILFFSVSRLSLLFASPTLAAYSERKKETELEFCNEHFAFCYLSHENRSLIHRITQTSAKQSLQSPKDEI